MEDYESNEYKEIIYYTYRKHLFVIAKLIPVIGVLSCIIFILGIIYVQQPVFTFIFGFIILEMIFSYYLYKGFTTMKLSIDEQGIHFENAKKQIEMAYSDISSISSKKLTSFGGWITLTSKTGEKFRLTVAMKDISEFIRRLHQYLLDHEREDLANEPLLQKAYRVATFIDHDFRRARYLGLGTFIYILLVIILAQVLSSYDFIFVKLALYISLLVFFVGFSILEYVYYKKKLMKTMEETQFEMVSYDEKAEKKMIHRFMFFGLMIHLVLTGIAIFIGL